MLRQVLSITVLSYHAGSAFVLDISLPVSKRLFLAMEPETSCCFTLNFQDEWQCNTSAYRL